MSLQMVLKSSSFSVWPFPPAKQHKRSCMTTVKLKRNKTIHYESGNSKLGGSEEMEIWPQIFSRQLKIKQNYSFQLIHRHQTRLLPFAEHSWPVFLKQLYVIKSKWRYRTQRGQKWWFREISRLEMVSTTTLYILVWFATLWNSYCVLRQDCASLSKCWRYVELWTGQQVFPWVKKKSHQKLKNLGMLTMKATM